VSNKQIRSPKKGDKLMIALKSGGEVPCEFVGYGELWLSQAIQVVADNMHFFAPAAIQTANIAAIQWLDEDDWDRVSSANAEMRKAWRSSADAVRYKGIIQLATSPESIEQAAVYNRSTQGGN